ncbi:MAG: AhpC/TSA family protein [Gemmatimonadaceae bacterium]|nr:AhpC/TSA family protein [Gemmatimonadaceae bacterium]
MSAPGPTDHAPARAVVPTRPAPPLSVQTVAGESWSLIERRPERFTMVVFYRGLHCPVCRTYLMELERKLDEFTRRGLDVIAVSGDDDERARRTVDEWKLARLTVGYGQSVASMREWGLFVSHGIKETEPELFGEPGLFLIQPDATLYYVGVNSMPFGRPRLDDMLAALDFIIARNYPARGEA